MAVADRRERENAAVRASIMDAARELFAEHGYEAVSMRKLAEAVDYTPAAIYVHFRDKEDLFRQICEDDFAKFHAGQSQVAAEPDPVRRIARMGEAYIRFAVENPNHFRRMFLDPPKLKLSEKELSKRGDPSADGYAFFRQSVAEAAKAGRFRKEFSGEVDLVTQTLWSAVHGVASIAVAYNHDESWVKLQPIDRLTESTIDAILKGLLSESKRSSHR